MAEIPLQKYGKKRTTATTAEMKIHFDRCHITQTPVWRHGKGIF